MRVRPAGIAPQGRIFILYNKAMAYIKRTYAALGRATHGAITPLLKRYMNEKHIRVRVVITNDDNEVLLVRSWLGRQQWSLPGGGVKRSETPAQAAAREVHEETGLHIPADHLTEIGSFPTQSAQYTFTVVCFKVEIAKREPRLRRHQKLEMLDISWFSRQHLPKDVSENVTKALALLGK